MKNSNINMQKYDNNKQIKTLTQIFLYEKI